MAAEFTEEEKATLKELFDAFDSDGDGKITQADLKAVCEQYGIKLTDEEANQVVESADSDNTGFICFDNFVDALVPLESRVSESRARRAFKAIDLDNTGTISADNLRDILDQTGVGKDISNDEIQQFMQECDTSGDGQISFEDFLTALRDAE